MGSCTFRRKSVGLKAHEKLLLLKDLMHNERGKEIAEKPHQFMEVSMTNFYDERNLNI
jgi:HD superfamily phosphodiesterase